ncbi:MAG: hypothetical protein RR880_06495 [Bacteroidales bacterium]
MNKSSLLSIGKHYSYLKASIGSSFEALTAGRYPDAIPTIKHTTIAVNIQSHGITNDAFIKTAVILPTDIPSTIPRIHPNWLITAVLFV